MDPEIDERRRVQSALSPDGSGGCRFKCAYCFAAEPAYHASISAHSDEFLESNDTLHADVVMIGADTELFQNPTAALATIRRLTQSKPNITFATKMILPKSTLEVLSEFAETLKRDARILSVMVSIPLWTNATTLEQLVPSPQRRADFVAILADYGLSPYVGIRPLLPAFLTPRGDYDRIVEATASSSLGYITGPYWFDADVLGLHAHGMRCERRPVHWLPDRPVWNVWEDPLLTKHVATVIRNHGQHLFERSSSAVLSMLRQRDQ